MKDCRRNLVVGIVCFILILGMVALASASEAAPSHETGQETVAQEIHEPVHEAESHEAVPEVHAGAEEAEVHVGEHITEEAGESHGEGEHAVAGEHGGGQEGEHEVQTREYGAPASLFFIGAIILLLYFVLTRYKYDKISDLSRKIPGLIATTIYIFSLMIIAHYIIGVWSLILVPVFLFALLKFWPHI